MKIPVTILTGFLGAGKTTLVNHLLKTAADRKIGVLVNDFGEINIDAELIVGTSEGVISLANGCICCTMQGDLQKSVLAVLERTPRPEHLLVEASGLSNPGPLAEVFFQLQKQGNLRLDGIVAVVDATRFPFDDLKGQPLARDQVLASDLVVLNKVDLVSSERVEVIKAAVRQRLPKARVIEAVRAQVPAEVLLGLSAWPADRVPPHVHGHDLEALGYRSLLFRSDRPFDFKKLVQVIEGLPTGIVREKGVILVKERPGDRLALNCVGRRVHVETLGPAEGTESVVVVIGEAAAFDEVSLREALGSALAQA
ncbi:MAG: GTP-binding protein [Deltaproteobacteria bacterium]|jgi:G3E family GTPase|nr:GTP-binding protein [Deltaproteobacteria bacterium]